MHNLISNAKVEVTNDGTSTSPRAAVVVNDKYTHVFDEHSRVSNHLMMMSEKDLATQMNGGTFFFIEDQLVDFRYASYDGFVQPEDHIDQLMAHIGYVDPRHSTLMSNGQLPTANFNLLKCWNEQSFEIESYKAGGEMKSHLLYEWSPFSSNIRASFEILRLICSNGMVGQRAVYNPKIPVINRWIEHLDMAANLIQSKIQETVSARLLAMNSERASVQDCAIVEKHVTGRLIKSMDAGRDDQVRRLQNIQRLVSAEDNLSSYYAPTVFSNRNFASRMPSHLMKVDLYNMVTEVRSHTSEFEKSSNNAIDGIANDLLFVDNSKMMDSSIHRFGKVAAAPAFNDPEAAFFGELVA